MRRIERRWRRTFAQASTDHQSRTRNNGMHEIFASGDHRDYYCHACFLDFFSRSPPSTTKRDNFMAIESRCHSLEVNHRSMLN